MQIFFSFLSIFSFKCLFQESFTLCYVILWHFTSTSEHFRFSNLKNILHCVEWYRRKSLKDFDGSRLTRVKKKTNTFWQIPQHRGWKKLIPRFWGFWQIHMYHCTDSKKDKNVLEIYHAQRGIKCKYVLVNTVAQRVKNAYT